MSFAELLPDDTFVARRGNAPRSMDMEMVVTAVLGDHLSANPTGEAAADHGYGSGYLFHRETGMEVDDDWGWGPNYGRSYSVILPGSARRPAEPKQAAQPADTKPAAKAAKAA
jgi:hypothetical protein